MSARDEIRNTRDAARLGTRYEQPALEANGIRTEGQDDVNDHHNT